MFFFIALSDNYAWFWFTGCQASEAIMCQLLVLRSVGMYILFPLPVELTYPI